MFHAFSYGSVQQYRRNTTPTLPSCSCSPVYAASTPPSRSPHAAHSQPPRSHSAAPMPAPHRRNAAATPQQHHSNTAPRRALTPLLAAARSVAAPTPAVTAQGSQKLSNCRTRAIKRLERLAQLPPTLYLSDTGCSRQQDWWPAAPASVACLW